MKKLELHSLAEFDAIFKEKSVEITKSIQQDIQEALRSGSKSASLFEIEIEELGTVLEVSLPKHQWTIALGNCLEHFREWNMVDDEIDTYLLIKELKNESTTI